MNNDMQHHNVILKPQNDKIVETRELLLKCEKQISLKRNENGPVSWCVSFDEENNNFIIDALFKNIEAVEFHQNNIKDIVQQFGQLMAAPPETVIKNVFSMSV